MMDILKKNGNAIFWGLVALLVFCSIWGSVNSRSAKTLKMELNELKTGLTATEAGQHEAEQALEAKATEVGTKAAELKAQVKELQVVQEKKAMVVEQLKKARKELVALRKGNKKLEAQAAEQKGAVGNLQKAVAIKDKQVGTISEELKVIKATSAITQQELDAVSVKYDEVSKLAEQLKQENGELAGKLEAVENISVEAQKQQVEFAAETKVLTEKLLSEVEVSKAQVLGYEKMVEEKSVALEETSQKLDRVKVNMEVLLSKISSQQDMLQELSQEKEELIKSLADKNKTLADLQDQLEQTPMQD